MNRVLFVVLFTGIFVISGCGEANKGPAVDGTSRFPAELAGRWKAEDKSGWEIVFEKDGSISSVVHTFGRFTLQPGKETISPMIGGGQSILQPGKWKVAYNHTTRMLEAEIVLEHFYTEMDEAVIEGSRKDIMAGQVSDDGKTWAVVCTSFMECTTIVKEVVKNLFSDPEHGDKTEFVFKKQSDQ